MGLLASETTCKGVSFSAFPASRIKMGTVEVLLSWRSPATIASAVRAVIIDSIKRFSQRPLTHICQEVHKRTPAFVNGDTSSPVEMIIRGLGLSASLPHSMPTAVGACPLACVMGMSMNPFTLSTAARLGSAAPQIAADYNLCITAVAPAFPCRVMVAVKALIRNYDKPPKALPNKFHLLHVGILPQIYNSLIYQWECA